MDFAKGITNSWLGYIGKTEATIIISALVIIATSFFIRAFYFAHTEELHRPGYMSNKQQLKLSSIREYLCTLFFVGLWCYVLWISLTTNSIFELLGKTEVLSVFLAILSLVFTLIFIFIMVSAFRYALPITFHGVFILTPVAILVGTYKYYSAVTYAYPGAVLLSAVILFLYLFFLRYFYSAILSISSISSVVLSNFRSIMRMFIPLSLILFMQIFTIFSIFNNSSQPVSYTQEAFLFLLLMWTMEIYSYFCKAFFASTTYLTLSGQSDVYSKSMRNTLASLPTIIYAALVPALLLSLQSILSKLSSGADKTNIFLITPVIRIILRILTYIVAVLVYVLESYNDIVIPYIGVYGGRYSSTTSDKANSIPLQWSNKLLFLLPKVKDFVFFPVALIVGTLPFLLDYLSEASLFGFGSIIEMFFSTTFTHGFSQVVFTISPKVLFIFFTVYVALTFFACLQSALYAKAFYDYDNKPLLKPLAGVTTNKKAFNN